jgi:hypothetical protein
MLVSIKNEMGTSVKADGELFPKEIAVVGSAGMAFA